MVSWPAIGRQPVSRPGRITGRAPTQRHQDADLLLTHLSTGVQSADLGLLPLPPGWPIR